ncbi:MAG: UTP--glucose-1-phosphate uridylyltransferase [Actinomycetia bacterium]|nr:UTP--glucose-1-phosphate uridylyltransferase [Actinomycetes bacterium]
MKAIIPSAGLGTRFLPVTKAQPKEMLPVLDKPIMQYVIEEAAAGGAEEILLVTGRGKRAIEDHFDRSAELEQILSQKGSEWLAAVQQVAELPQLYYVRQKSPLGLGHAVRCGAAFTNSEPFYVLLGDIVVPRRDILPKLAAVYAQTGASVIAVERVPDELIDRYGIVGVEPCKELGEGCYQVNALVEKPAPDDAPSDLAIMGRYLLTPHLMELLENTTPGEGGEIQLTDALVALLADEPLYAVEIAPQASFDTGNVLSWLEANITLALRDERYADDLKELLADLLSGERAHD